MVEATAAALFEYQQLQPLEALQ